MGKLAVIQELEAEQLKTDIPEFRVGDTLKVHLRIIEGDKERIQVFTGTVIARKGTGLSETITLHRVAYSCSMERVFFLHSPKIAKMEVTRRGRVRRAKLYYLRGTYGKKAKVRELIGAKRAAVPAKSPEPKPEPEAEATAEPAAERADEAPEQVQDASAPEQLPPEPHDS